MSNKIYEKHEHQIVKYSDRHDSAYRNSNVLLIISLVFFALYWILHSTAYRNLMFAGQMLALLFSVPFTISQFNSLRKLRYYLRKDIESYEKDR